jgi:small subunit ribosomal protein S2
MDHLPGALFVVDVCRETNAVKEARRLGIPVVAIVDTNADPDPIDYVIPGNDDAIRGIKLIADAIAKVLKESSDQYARVASERNRQAEAERVTADAQDKATRKTRREGAPADGVNADTAKSRLARTRRTAAQTAQENVAARAAAVETDAAEAVEEPAGDAAPQA